jgi:hypothetical protein
MPCEILIKGDQHGDGTIGYEHPDPVKDKAGVYKKGYPVVIKPYPHPGWGYKEGYPYFVQIRVTDGDVSDVEALIASSFSETSIIQDWSRVIDFATVNNDPVIDGWRIRVFATNPGANNYAGVTQSMVENYLTKWNAEVFSATANEVQFDVAIYEDGSSNPGAIQSEGFWGIAPTGVVFSEDTYDQGTGDHTVEADYSVTSFTADQVANRVAERGGTINSNTGGIINFTINRTDVFQHFQEEVRQALDQIIYRRQFRVAESTVDTIVSTGIKTTVSHSKGDRDYYTLEVTLAQLETYLLNRLDETIT